jgi:hypothetical protein
MIEVKDLEQTCAACPAQWEFRTFRDRPAYVRFRWGHLSIRIGPPGGDVYDAVGGYEIYSEQMSDGMDGSIEWEKVYDKLYPLDQGLLEETLIRKGI